MNYYISQTAIALYVLAGLCTSCNDRPNLNWALDKAGNNRQELEKVIEHYSTDEADKEKLAAAIFLIENMPGHYSYRSERIEEYYAEADSILDQKLTIDEKIKALTGISQKYSNLKKVFKEDITFISAEYLIHSIDRAYRDWKEKPWAKTLDFDQFCEFLLPYKCTELQQLDYWWDTLAVKYDSILNAFVLHSDEGRNNTLDAAHTVHTELKIRLPIHLFDQTKESVKFLPLLSANNIDRLPAGFCKDYCILTIATLRSQGVPGVIDYVSSWGRKWLGHDWNVTFSKWGEEIPYDGVIGAWPADRFWPVSEPKPKVFRRTYAINHDALTYLNETKYLVSSLNNIFCKDVTDHYGKVTTIPVTPLEPGILKDKYIYLSVFDNRDWKPVTFKKIKRNTALFDKMGRDIVYMPYGYDGDTLVPIAYPVIARLEGSLDILEPDTIHTHSVRLIRKYFKDNHCLLMEARVASGRIQAANHADFSDAETLFQVDSLQDVYAVSLRASKPYRFWRFIPPETQSCNIAELKFFRRNDTIPLLGKIITKDPGSLNDDPNSTPDKAFDNEPLTYYDPPSINGTTQGAWIGMDYGQPVGIDSMILLPRSDDNTISPGDEYELKYWNKTGWVSLGKQVAKDFALYFDNVPTNALLLLRDLTRGKQERIFTYEQGKQIFW